MVAGLPGGSPAEWATLLALVLGPGLVATLLWSPILAFGRIRSLFGSLPISRYALVNYAVAGLALSLPWVVGYGWAFGEIGAGLDGGSASGRPLVSVAVQLAGLYVVGLPVLAGAGLPHLGVDWDPADYGSSTWVVLVGASAWYAAVYTVPAVLLGLLYSL